MEKMGGDGLYFWRLLFLAQKSNLKNRKKQNMNKESLEKIIQDLEKNQELWTETQVLIDGAEHLIEFCRKINDNYFHFSTDGSRLYITQKTNDESSDSFEIPVVPRQFEDRAYRALEKIAKQRRENERKDQEEKIDKIAKECGF
jgi:hypothetical protein